MLETTPSQTALSVAWLRAAHQVLDSPAILSDVAVFSLLGPTAREQIQQRVDELQTRSARALRSHIALRSRYTEDGLAYAVRRGVKQYVILGGGYDTFCLRQPKWARSLRITEVDRLATQRDKISRLREAGLVVPDNVAFLTADFESETLNDALQRGGIDLTIPTFFSCLGVIIYLTPDAIDALFSTVADFASGSEIVFTFSQRRDNEDPTARAAAAKLAAQVAEVGEPFQSYFETEELREKLEAFGFQQIDFLTPSAAEKRYFAGRTDSLPLPRRISIASGKL